MALARQCDRCGELYKPDKAREFDGHYFNAIQTVDKNIDSYHPHKAYDLCPTCIDSFVEWFENKPEPKED